MVSVQLVPVFAWLFIGVFVTAIGPENFISRRYNNHPFYQRARQRVSSNQVTMNAGSVRDANQPQISATLSNSPLQTDDTETELSYGNDYDQSASGSMMMINPVSTIVAPLAALALLGTAATVSTIYPVLMPVAGLSNGGRRGRDAERTATGRISAPTRRTELEVKLKEIETLEKFIAKIPEQEKQQEKLMATYLSCSGFTESDNPCLDRVVCDYSMASSKMSSLEKDVISIVLYNIMSNTFVPKELKERLRSSARFGRDHGHCAAFACRQLDYQG